MENDKPFMNIPLAIYLSLIVANILFAILYPENWIVGLLGALFFLVCWIKSGRKKLTTPKLLTTQEKSDNH